MSTLRKLLTGKGYTRIKLNPTATNHLELKAAINEIEGTFLLDTGASSSCVGFDTVDYFKLMAEDSEIRAAGAGATNMLTQISSKNSLKIADWKKKNLELVLFDLKHVNEALTKHKADPVHGIIGADVLKKGKAVIDYKNKCLYLKH